MNYTKGTVKQQRNAFSEKKKNQQLEYPHLYEGAFY